MATALSLAYAANVGLGALMIVLGLVVARASPDRVTRAPLGAFLALVGANYLLDGLANVVGGAATNPLRHAALLAALLDPAALLLFALAAHGGPLARGRALLAATPSVVLAALYLATAPSAAYLGVWPFRAGQAAQLAVIYPLGFLLLARRLLAETSPVLKDRYALLVVAFGIVAIPRIPLLLVDVGLVQGAVTPPVSGFLLLAAGLAASAAAGVGALLLAARGDAVARRAAGSLALGLAAVAVVWTAAVVPGFRPVSFALLYACRWFLFVPLVVAGARRFDLFGLPLAAQRGLGAGLVALLFAVFAVELGAVLATLAGLSVGEALGAGATVSALMAVGIFALRHAVPRADERAWSARTVYRAHVEAGADPAERGRLARRLGLDPSEAADVEATALRERRRQPAAAIRSGEVLDGRYQVGEPLGAGAWGRVHAGHDRMRSEPIVLKELLLAWQGDRAALEAYRREAEALCLLRHPNVVGFRAIVPTADGYVLVLDRVPGESLATRLARGPLSPGEAARMAGGLLDGLAALHAAGFVHRDVKPANVMLRPDGSAVLLDLGAAGRAGGTRAGPQTPAYAAPEQVRGEAVTPAADVYAAGVVLWEALTGRPVREGAPPPGWRALLERAVAAEPAARFGDAAAMRAALPGA